VFRVLFAGTEAGVSSDRISRSNRMSDRKYRHRGYRDEGGDRAPAATPRKPPPEPGAPAGARRLSSQDGPRALNMPGYRSVVRCAQCGAAVLEEVGLTTRCARCAAELHACAQCTSFDPGSRFECMQPVTARISPKNAGNTCSVYTPRTTVERETTTPRSDDARKAFDDLFNL